MVFLMRILDKALRRPIFFYIWKKGSRVLVCSTGTSDLLSVLHGLVSTTGTGNMPLLCYLRKLVKKAMSNVKINLIYFYISCTGTDICFS
jgi:hypothetical protein